MPSVQAPRKPLQPLNQKYWLLETRLRIVQLNANHTGQPTVFLMSPRPLQHSTD